MELLSSAPFWFFFNRITPELREEIVEGKVHFPQPFWSKISREAKDFVSSLLQVDPDKRKTKRIYSHI